MLLGALYGMPTAQAVFKLPIVFLPYRLGPLVSGLFLTAVTTGKMGFRTLFSRLLRWWVNWRWYAAARLTAPLLALSLLLIFSFVNPDYLPAVLTADEKGSLLLSGRIKTGSDQFSSRWNSS